jgi:hypothetical protein
MPHLCHQAKRLRLEAGAPVQAHQRHGLQLALTSNLRRQLTTRRARTAQWLAPSVGSTAGRIICRPTWLAAGAWAQMVVVWWLRMRPPTMSEIGLFPFSRRARRRSSPVRLQHAYASAPCQRARGRRLRRCERALRLGFGRGFIEQAFRRLVVRSGLIHGEENALFCAVL